MNPRWLGEEEYKRWQEERQATKAADLADIVKTFNLPDEWAKPVPPPQTVEIDYSVGWNREWLAGLESFVRRIAREELGVADQKPDTRDRIPCADRLNMLDAEGE